MFTDDADVCTSKSKVLEFWNDVQSRFPNNLCDDQFHESLTYIWTFCRCAVLVMVRDYRVRLFLPFCNRREFRNDYQLDLSSVDTSGEIHPSKWWGNADLLCSRAQGPNGWTTSQLGTYAQWLQSRQWPRHHTFFLNKRDAPLVRRDRSRPYHHLYTEVPMEPVVPTNMLEVWSPYTSQDFADHAIPCSHDLESMREQVEWSVEWSQRLPRAMFRGSATSSVRRELCEKLADHPMFDVALTYSRGGRLWCDRGRVWRTKPSGDSRAYLPPESWSRYKVLIAVEGHSGLNRWSNLLCSGAYVVHVCRQGKPTALLSRHRHAFIDASKEDWIDDLVATVQELLGRPTGPDLGSVAY